MKFDFRRKLKNMTLEQLQELKSYHVGRMLDYQGLDSKSSDRHFRYVGYIDDQIKRITK